MLEPFQKHKEMNELKMKKLKALIHSGVWLGLIMFCALVFWMIYNIGFIMTIIYIMVFGGVWGLWIKLKEMKY
tara:strand:- start:2775 stop:2993 length:219 start_codon:yes stop_codon:yes gene_type:complete